jgi:four helix bundle protein
MGTSDAVGFMCADGTSMAGVKRFQELIAWQRCRQLSDIIFEITETGPAARNIEFRQQIRDAAQGAAPLIAEGFVRYLPGDFARYLRMARAEIAEVQSNLEEARAKKYFSDDQEARASIIARRAMSLTTRLLVSKLRQIESERKRKNRRRPK